MCNFDLASWRKAFFIAVKGQERSDNALALQKYLLKAVFTSINPVPSNQPNPDVGDAGR